MVKLNEQDYKNIYKALEMRKYFLLCKETLNEEEKKELKELKETTDKIVDIYFFRR